MPDRHGPLKTGLGQFVASVNPGGIAGGALAVGGDGAMGIEGAALGVFEGEPTVAGDDVGLFVPAGSRTKPQNDPRVQMGKTLVTIPGVTNDQGTYSAESPAFIIDSGIMFPSGMGFDARGADDAGGGDGTRFVEEYVPGVDAGDASDVRVLVPNGREFVDRHGPMKMPDDARTVEPGEPVDLANKVVAGPTDRLIPGIGAEADASILDEGVPVAMAGATFGLAALSTPSASVAGQEANPLVGIETTTLLERDVARRMLRRAGVTDADRVEWLAGPEPAAYPGPGEYTVGLLGESTDLELHQGVVSGNEGPWGVAVLVARATPDDHVIAAGVIRRPVGTADIGLADVWSKDYLKRAAEFAAEAMGSLEAVGDDG